MNDLSTIEFAFIAGRTYFMHSIGDHDCVWERTVVRRTAKTVWLRDHYTGEVASFRISVYRGEEMVSPLGKYSMSPILGAEKIRPEPLRLLV